ncbi:hypothetical protein M3689_01055 [Alkalihalophilus marmarensis]|jgi:hypothetical protein|uniref:hypothetical protein n=1 Tax=Alkalihalophilus marmarensis TaxID=521377 RepID=UPI00203FE2A5|nr:hypothetical protein [Alkalihalophilus marmarensis]MCM3487887.1 hypothetical protein [Alkalihalophilus marmarensis]
MTKLSRPKQDELIAEEVEKWNEMFKELPSKKQEVAKRLIERVAFMTITLQILEDEIKLKGPTIKFENGTQKMFVENPSQKSYNTMINRYTSACEKLFALLPDDLADTLKKKTKNERSPKDLL